MALMNNGPDTLSSFELNIGSGNSGTDLGASFLLSNETSRRTLPTATVSVRPGSH